MTGSRPRIGHFSVRVIAGLLVLWPGLAAVAAAPRHQGDSPPPSRLPWTGPNGEPLPFASDEEVLDFLRTAEVISSEEVPGGINHPLRLLLRRGEVSMHAIFRTVDDRRRQYRTHDRTVLKFHDYHGFEIAAYRLARLLGAGNVPPAAARVVDGRPGSIQAWVERTRTEGGRRQDGDQSPRIREWVRQWQTMQVFDALIDNFDRNIGNILIDPAWKIWLIDHTRSFTIHRHLYRPDRIHLCERGMWRRLRALDESTVQEHLGDELDSKKIAALIRRRELLIAYLEGLIAERGEAIVLFDLDPAQ